MSKELEAFNKIVDLKYELEDIVYDLPTCFDLTELDGDEESIVEKGLNALDIIKEKKVNLDYLKSCENYEQYKTVCSYWNEITQNQFDLLKEVL